MPSLGLLPWGASTMPTLAGGPHAGGALLSAGWGAQCRGLGVGWGVGTGGPWLGAGFWCWLGVCGGCRELGFGAGWGSVVGAGLCGRCRGLGFGAGWGSVVGAGGWGSVLAGGPWRVRGSLCLTPPLPRDSVDLRLEELKPFIPPAWMTEKMQKHMETLRRGGDAPPPEGPPES